MNMLFELGNFVVVVSFIISLVTLICFFVLCKRVGIIMHKLNNVDINFKARFYYYLSIGESDRSRKLLIEEIYNLIGRLSFNHRYLSDDALKEYIDGDSIKNIIEKTYKKEIEIAGITIDYDLIKKTFKNIVDYSMFRL